MLYPLKFEPIYKENIWGGNQLKTKFNREIPSDHTGESWDIACHEHGQSIISNGPLKGKTLDEIFKSNKADILGEFSKSFEKFPLLIKIIDAKDRLSLQVHPDDLFAKLLEPGEFGKCEMWYVLDAEEDAKIAIGLKDGVTKQDFIQGLIDGNLEACVHELPVKKGDVINIPAGLVHAIEEGIVIAEVQQNSDTVYRVYDWNRMGLDGKPRDLHIERALGSIDFQDTINKSKIEGLCLEDNDNKRHIYIGNSHFAIEKLDIKKIYKHSTKEEKMMIYFCLEGSYELKWNDLYIKVNKGESVLLPSSLGDYTIEGQCSILEVFIPDLERDIIAPLKEYGYSDVDIASKVALM